MSKKNLENCDKSKVLTPNGSKAKIIAKYKTTITMSESFTLV